MNKNKQMTVESKSNKKSRHILIIEEAAKVTKGYSGRFIEYRCYVWEM